MNSSRMHTTHSSPYRGVSLTETPWTETTTAETPGKRTRWTETDLDRDPPTEILQTETPGQRPPPWKEHETRHSDSK